MNHYIIDIYADDLSAAFEWIATAVSDPTFPRHLLSSFNGVTARFTGDGLNASVIYCCNGEKEGRLNS